MAARSPSQSRVLASMSVNRNVSVPQESGWAGVAGGAVARRRRRLIELRALLQDLAFESLDARGRLQTEFLGQGAAKILVGRQSLGLPAEPVQRQHLQAPEALPEGVIPGQGLDGVEGGGRAAGGQLCVGQILGHVEPGLVQADRRHPGEVPVDEIGEGRPPPQRQRLPEAAGGVGRRPFLPGRPTLGGEVVEAVDVDLIFGVRVQDVDAAVGRDREPRPGRHQRPAQPRHQRVDRGGDAGGRRLAPQLLGQGVEAHPPVQGEHRQHGALLGTADRHGPPVDRDGQGPQDPDVDPRHVGHVHGCSLSAGSVPGVDRQATGP